MSGAVAHLVIYNWLIATVSLIVSCNALHTVEINTVKSTGQLNRFWESTGFR